MSDGNEALRRLDDILKEADSRTAVLSEDDIIGSLNVEELLNGRDIDVLDRKGEHFQHRDASFSADAGITGADYALADTGTIVIFHNSSNNRLISLAPPTHVAIVDMKNLLPDIDTLVGVTMSDERGMPSAMSLITGPSMTADIALQATYGMHGPKNLQVILIE